MNVSYLFAVLVLFVPHVITLVFKVEATQEYLLVIGATGASAYLVYNYLHEKKEVVGALVESLLGWGVAIAYTVSMFEVSKNKELLDVPSDIVENIRLNIIEICGIIINITIWAVLVIVV